jgi:hypothetical protein
MSSKRLLEWICDRRAYIGRAVAAARAEPGPTSSPEWYAGLVVSPASFSRQLSDMQLSLMRANDPQSDDSEAKVNGHTEDEAAMSQRRN